MSGSLRRVAYNVSTSASASASTIVHSDNAKDANITNTKAR
jgi:hypothetical protein